MRPSTRFSSALPVGFLLVSLLASVGFASGQEGSEAALDARIEGLSTPPAGTPLAEWAAGWIDGPVSLVATDEERELFAELESTRERLQFIRLFWERRDPVPRGARNEYLDEFAERLDYAQERFGSGRDAGWQTLFGRVVMLFGEPDRERRELSLGGDLSDRPPILWSYDAAIPRLDANEDLLFVFRGGRWRLYPPSGFGEGGVAELLRESERASPLAEIPSDYLEAMATVVDGSLRNPVDYSRAIANVRTRVRAPESDIPFSWTPVVAATGDGGYEVTLELAFRTDSLVFELGERGFATDMSVEVRLLDGGEPVAAGGNRITLTIPEDEMEDRREEVVRHRVAVEGELDPGVYRVEIDLIDSLLGYRTRYDGEVTVGS